MAISSSASPPPQKAEEKQWFLRKAGWEASFLFQDLFSRIVDRFIAEPRTILLACHDTLEKRTGLKIQGGGTLRYAIRSTRKLAAYAGAVSWAASEPPIGLPRRLRLCLSGRRSCLEFRNALADSKRRSFPLRAHVEDNGAALLRKVSDCRRTDSPLKADHLRTKTAQF